MNLVNVLFFNKQASFRLISNVSIFNFIYYYFFNKNRLTTLPAGPRGPPPPRLAPHQRLTGPSARTAAPPAGGPPPPPNASVLMNRFLAGRSTMPVSRPPELQCAKCKRMVCLVNFYFS